MRDKRIFGKMEVNESLINDFERGVFKGMGWGWEKGSDFKRTFLNSNGLKGGVKR